MFNQQKKNGDITPVTLGHSYYRSSLSGKAKRIKETVEQSPIPITPLEISQKTGIKPSTTRKYVSRLARKGYITKVCYGYYVGLKSSVTLESSIVKGGCDLSPRLHALRLRKTGGLIGEPCGWKKDFGPVVVSFQRFRIGSVTVIVDCKKDVSLDYPGFRLLLDAMGEDLRLLGVQDWKTMVVSTFEFNHDFQGIRVDGVKAVTVEAFDGGFRRFYNKRFGLRDEVKAVGSRRVEDVLLLMQGGVSTYSILQYLTMTLQQLEARNKIDSENASLLQGLVRELFRQNNLKDRIDSPQRLKARNER